MTRELTGTIQTLFVEGKEKDGYLVTHNGQAVFLPEKETEQVLETGDYIDVFLYGNDKGRLIATTVLPHIVMNTFGWAKVVKIVPRIGLFVSIGTKEDVLVPKDDLPPFMSVWPQVGEELYVTLDLDREGRLLARVAKEGQMEDALQFASSDDINLNDNVSGRVYFTSKEGSVILTEQNYRGFIHNTEREREPRLGELVEGRVIEVKEDGTLNVSLLPLKHERIDDDAEKIITYLKENDKFMSLNDRSKPELIRHTFNMSKSAFKRALGRLMREKKITQDQEGTRLTEEKEE